MRPSDPRLRAQLAPARSALAGVVAAGVVASLLVIAQAWAVTGLVVAVLHGDRVATWAGVAAAVFLARAVTGWASDTLAVHAAVRVGTALRRRIVAPVLRVRRADAPPVSSGELSVLTTRGVAAAEPYLTRYLPALVLAGVLPLLTLVAIATQDLLSALIVACTLPLVPVFGALVGLATRDRAETQWRAMASLSGHFLDVVRGLPTLVAHRRARAQSRAIEAATDRYRVASLGTLRLAFASSAVLETVATISVALVAVVVGVRLAAGTLDLHTALVVLLLAPEAYWPLRRVGAEFHAAAEGIATFEAVDALADVAAPEPAGHPAVPGTPLRIDHLSFTYPGRTDAAVDDLTVTVPAAGVTVLTGPSGCGKSTVLAVLAGLLPATSGAITAAGTPVGGARWREQVALLPQRPVFVDGSIGDNLRLAAPDATDADLWEALRRVALEERVRTLPHGLTSSLAEDGASLSAGERARLALARIVLGDRPWVLLDEPTAHLDDLTEQVIADTIVELGRSRAVVVVAHRPALVELADHVITLAPTTRTAQDRVAAPDVRPTRRPARDSEPPRPRHDRRALWGSTVVSALASASGVALTATAGWLIVQASTRPAVLTLLVAIVAVRTFGLARPALRYLERLRSHDVALRMLARRRVEVYDALVPLVPGRLGRRRGDVLASIVDDVDSVVDRELRVRMPVRSLVAVVVGATVLAWFLLPAAATVIGLAAVSAAGTGFAVARFGAARAERLSVELRAALSTSVVETVQVAPELIMWQADAAACDAVAAASDALGRATTRSGRWLALARALALTLSGAGVAGTALVVAPAVATGRLSGPTTALLVLLPLALAELAVPMADAGALSARTTAAARRLRLLERAGPAVRDTAARALVAPPRVGLRDVRAGWSPTSSPLRHLSMDVAVGERIAVVGSSGSGKSTLAALLLRFIDPQDGDITLGDVALPWLALDDVRRTVGLVDDDPHVFASTLVENVRLARPGATDAEVEVALRQAGLADWLQALPEGLHTWLGDGHAQVSGGERARIGVARVLLADQPVVVLDEPTAHLDHATASALAREILTGPRTRSIVWITHDRVGLDLVDSVVDLDALVLPGPVAAYLSHEP